MFYVPGQGKILLNGYCGFIGKQVGQRLKIQGIEWSGHEINSESAFEGKMPAASIVIAVVGKPRLLPVNYLNGQKLVIDAGYGVYEKGIISSDVHSTLHLTHGRVTHITPVPYGCRPLEMAIRLERFICMCLKRIYKSPQVYY